MTELRSAFVAPIQNLLVRDSGEGDGRYTVKGMAVVYGRSSVDLGGFTEVMAPGCLREVLATRPDVHLMWQHDATRILARTRSKTLTLDDVQGGLAIWARVSQTSYAADLRALLKDGVVDQMSFAFTTPEDGSGETWDFPENRLPRRTVTNVAGLYDVTICARGAYPQTSVALAARSALIEHAQNGHPPATGAEPDPTFEQRKATLAAANARLIALS